jgi:predicted TIM-barrel fold metal-dependent hydrolase
MSKKDVNPRALEPPPVIIDWHSHWIPPDLASRVAAHRDLPVAPEFFDVEARIRHMDVAGISRQVISWPKTFGMDAVLPLEEATRLYRDFNDRLGDLIARWPDRFSGLAAVPTADPSAAAEELSRSQSKRGIIGAVVPADAFLTPAGAEQFSPLLAVAQRLRSHLYVHPGPTGLKQDRHDPIQFLRLDTGSPRWLLETGTRLGAAALTLETSGILGPYPDVSVHVAMLGGHLGWIAETLADRAKDGGGSAMFPLRRIYVDTGILKAGGRAFASAVAAFGADRVLFGSDYPQFSTRQPLEAFKEADLPEDVQRKILFENGSRLIGKAELNAASW